MWNFFRHRNWHTLRWICQHALWSWYHHMTSCSSEELKPDLTHHGQASKTSLAYLMSQMILGKLEKLPVLQKSISFSDSHCVAPMIQTLVESGVPVKNKPLQWLVGGLLAWEDNVPSWCGQLWIVNSKSLSRLALGCALHVPLAPLRGRVGSSSCVLTFRGGKAVFLRVILGIWYRFQGS